MEMYIQAFGHHQQVGYAQALFIVSSAALAGSTMSAALHSAGQ
jgi:hypothetical protein